MVKKFRKLLSKYIDIEIIERIENLKKPILAWTTSCFIDLFVIYLASRIFKLITINVNFKEATIFCFLFIFIIFFRTYLIIILRRYASFLIYKNKNEEELILVEKFINNRIFSNNNDNESIESFKESIINSTADASGRFDLPIVAGMAEVLFGILGLFYLLKILGLNIFLINIPIIIILFFFSKINSNKIFRLGKLLLYGTEKKLLSIDNITELSYELSALKQIKPMLKIFDQKNKIYNNQLNQINIRINSVQITIESLSLLIILFSLISIVFGFTKNSLVDSASVLALLSRIIPSVTRCIAYYSQIQFGISSVKKLWKLKHQEIYI